ncbi:MAG: AMP-binding protein [Aquabacterium sp.]|jgi:acyl-CoA synthetase (AMP-forming)/AMP-acid ligase II|uniref:AMP-binding protein n=1 Tax=Aquabacterium sp. TaxID=1872578 RepID=UPI002A369C7F|nr:AMP-binding protein [Aquabacterium sp.]MDX9843052.1 AMP-binding protein [Aquabacterium sp.]
MREWIPLSELACRPADANRVVARQADGALGTHADFLALVVRWQRAFLAQEGRAWALYVQDPLTFAAALFGAWHAGKEVVLPGDDRPATLAALREMGCCLAGDLPEGLQAAAPGGDLPARHPLNLDATVLKVFTSGSQGHPQAIDKTLAPFWSEVEALEQAFGGRMDQGGTVAPVVWATVSHQHIYGLLFLVLWPLAAGRPLATQRLLYPEDMILALCAGPAVLVATPAHLKRLGEHLNWAAVRANVRAVFSSGGPLPFEVSTQVADLIGQRPIEVFGSSETGGIAWRQASEADTAWAPFADVQWRMEEGCLSVHSPRLPLAGWWRTSDRVEAAGQGSFRLLGRLDRIVKIEEKRVSLTAVEQALRETEWVQEARAVVVPTPIGERVGAVLVASSAGQALLAQGRRVLTDRLKEALMRTLEPMALPRRWRFVEAMPLNAQGKTPEGLLRELFAEAAPSGTAMPESPTVTWLTRGADEALASLDIHERLSVFKGHFDRAPILPGVAQLDWALMLGRASFDLPPHFVRLEALKFVNPVTPGTTLYVSLQRKTKPQELDLAVLQFRLYSQAPQADADGEVREHASGRAVWRVDEGVGHV